MLRVIRNHRRAAHGERARLRGARARRRCRSTHAHCPDTTLAVAAPCAAWDAALALGEQHGYRNAQATVIAPTGTIGLVMDCDTTGIEPDFALVKFKKLAGGGYFKIINQAVPDGAAHARLRPGARSRTIDRYAVGHGTLTARRRSTTPRCRRKGFADGRDRRPSKQALASAFDIKFVFNKWTLGEEFCSDALEPRRADSSTISASTCSASSASPSARSTPPTSMSAAR